VDIRTKLQTEGNGGGGGGDEENNSNNNKNTVQRRSHVRNVTHQSTAVPVTIKPAAGRMRAPGETRFAIVARRCGQAR